MEDRVATYTYIIYVSCNLKYELRVAAVTVVGLMSRIWETKHGFIRLPKLSEIQW